MCGVRLAICVSRLADGGTWVIGSVGNSPAADAGFRQYLLALQVYGRVVLLVAR